MEQAERSLSPQEMLFNLQQTIEIQRSEYLAAQDAILSLKIGKNRSDKAVAALQQQVQQLNEQIEVGKKQVEQLLDSQDLLKEKYQGATWYLSKLSDQEVTPEFLAEVHQMWLSFNDQLKRAENKAKVQKTHDGASIDEETKETMDRDARSVVLRREKDIPMEEIKGKKLEVDPNDSAVITDINKRKAQEQANVEASDISKEPEKTLAETHGGEKSSKLPDPKELKMDAVAGSAEKQHANLQNKHRQRGKKG